MRPDWENECVSKSALIEWLRPYLHTGEPITADLLISDIQMMPPTLTPPNEPLTLDELLKMDGQPVYVVFRPDSSGERSQSWALVNVDEKYSEVYLVDSIPGASCYYDEVWADLEGIYRRPPEGET